MGIRERRDIEKAEMKKKIMEAVIDIIEQEGYEKLSIRKIATKIDYSPTTIYLYYKDKAEIIKDMSDMLYGKVMSDVDNFINENTNLLVDEQLRNILCIFTRGLCNEPEMVKAIMYSGMNVIFANDSTNGKPSNSGIDILDNLISEGIMKEFFRPCVKNTSWMILSSLLGFVLSSIANKLYLQKNFNQNVEEFIKILMEGIMQ